MAISHSSLSFIKHSSSLADVMQVRLDKVKMFYIIVWDVQGKPEIMSNMVFDRSP